MSTKAMSFSGVTPDPLSPVPDRGASAFYGDRRFRNHTQVGLRPAHTAIRLSSCIFSHGEVDGAEGIDGAEI
jgi:hypothetical protein